MLLWDLGVAFCQAALAWRYGLRIEGREHIPTTGPVIFVANHQSLLDPMIHGVAATARAPRPMAKESLFRIPLLGWFLKEVGCISVREQGANRDSLRAALDELLAGRTVLLYPEGRRSDDGEVKAFQRGIEFLLRKSNASIVPMGVDGAFAAWPRSQKYPAWRGRVWAIIGPAIPPNEVERLLVDPAAGLASLRDRVDSLMRQCRARLADRAGSGDQLGEVDPWLS